MPYWFHGPVRHSEVEEIKAALDKLASSTRHHELRFSRYVYLVIWIETETDAALFGSLFPQLARLVEQPDKHLWMISASVSRVREVLEAAAELASYEPVIISEKIEYDSGLALWWLNSTDSVFMKLGWC